MQKDVCPKRDQPTHDKRYFFASKYITQAWLLINSRDTFLLSKLFPDTRKFFFGIEQPLRLPESLNITGRKTDFANFVKLISRMVTTILR